MAPHCPRPDAGICGSQGIKATATLIPFVNVDKSEEVKHYDTGSPSPAAPDIDVKEAGKSKKVSANLSFRHFLLWVHNFAN
jgi:hypothetical protein